MRVQVVMNGLVSYRGCDEADIKGDAEIFGGLRHDSAGGELVNLDAHIKESRIYGAVLDQEPLKRDSSRKSSWGSDNSEDIGKNEIELTTIECDLSIIRFSK